MRTVTGLFDDYDDASAAVSRLGRAGTRQAISALWPATPTVLWKDPIPMLPKALAPVLASARLLVAPAVCWRDLS